MKPCIIVFFLVAVSMAFAEPVDVNTADSAKLQTIKGVGSALALRILEYRKAHGPFKSFDQLTKVSGIGPATLKTMKPFLTLSSATPSPDGTPATKIDLNTVTMTQLQTLPGIGEVLARRIIDHRTANGLFNSLEELSAIKGFNDSTVEKLSKRLFVAGGKTHRAPAKLKIYRPRR